MGTLLLHSNTDKNYYMYTNLLWHPCILTGGEDCPLEEIIAAGNAAFTPLRVVHRDTDPEGGIFHQWCIFPTPDQS